MIRIDDITDEHHWTAFHGAALAHGRSASLSVPLILGGVAQGGLNTYGAEPGGLQRDRRAHRHRVRRPGNGRRGQRQAYWASFDATRTSPSPSRTGPSSSKLQGVLTRHGESDDEAFIELRRRSQHAQPQTARHRHRPRRTSLATAAIVTADVNDLDQARRRLGLSFYDLWVRYIGLGGHDDAFGVRSYLSGGPAISDGEHDRLVLALNEAFVDAGNGRPLSFRPRLNPHRAPHPGYRRVERTPEGSSLRTNMATRSRR